MDREYVLGSSTGLDHHGLDLLQKLVDPPTTMLLDQIGVTSGWRCLELGPGGGSIARWLAERSGPAGRVVAVDLDPHHLDAPSGVEVLRHDISTGFPVDSSFDLIHARNVLMRLPRREHVFGMLVDALAPGGWIMVGDAGNRPQQILSAPSPADAELAERLVRTALHLSTQTTGVSWHWAHLVEGQMAAAGLGDIHGLEYSRMLSGGNVASRLNESYVRQYEPAMLTHGVPADDLERFHELMSDPAFRAWPFLQMVFTLGRKPG